MIKDLNSNSIKDSIRSHKRYLLLALVIIAAVVYFLLPSDESIYVGTIEVTEVDVAPRVSSQIAERLADEGDLVREGDLLYRLSCEEVKVEARKAENDYMRAEKLLASGNMSPERYDSYKRTYDDAMWRLKWCEVRSPMDGTVLTKFHEAGDFVFTGTKLMAMGDLTDVWAYVYVDQPFLASLSIGQDVTGVLPELDDMPIPGRIIHIKDQAEFTPKNVQTRKERTRLVYGIKIRFDNEKKLLKPGMPIEVRFERLKR